MNKPNHILLPFLLLISSTIFGQGLKTDSTMSSIFNIQEINNLEKILDFFTEQICELEGIENHNVIDCFNSYCKNLKEMSAASGSIDINLSLDEQKRFYDNIQQSTFNQIWHYEKTWIPNTTDTIFEINIDPKGKYAKFLKSMGQEYDKVDEYFNNLESSGGICPSMISELLMNYQEFKFNDERIRLLFAIHYLTINDRFSEKKDN